jgi:hypothetical protein
LRHLLAQLGDITRGEARALGAETRGDIVGHRRDLVVGIGVAEGRHRERAVRRQSRGPPQHDLRDIGAAGIVDRGVVLVEKTLLNNVTRYSAF